MIPFPIRTLDFGIKGGTTLNEVIKDDRLDKALSANKPSDDLN